MKFYKIILFLLVSINLNAQHGGASQEQIKLPDLVTPSPQAAELSKYGNVPLNESAGVANVSIPLPTYKVANLSVPINLTYSGDGVKVEEVPTWTGIDWNLNVGGVITRVVKDLPDDSNKPRYFYSSDDLNNFKQYITTIKCCDKTEEAYCKNPTITEYFGLQPLPQDNNRECEYLDMFTGTFINNCPHLIPMFKFEDQYDSLNDEYMFSFPGYSGTFVMIKNALGVFEAKLLKYDSELKIEVIGEFKDTSNYQFLITAPDGTKYYFGGSTIEMGSTIFNNTIATESSQFVDRSISPPIFGKLAKTSFYLTKIEHFSGDKIFFEYETDLDYEVHSRRNQLISNGLFIATSNAGILKTNLVRNKISNGKFLKRIWNNRNNLDLIFNSFSVFSSNNTSNNILKYRVLEKINYEDITVLFKYDKTNQSLQSGTYDKFFLTEVEKNNPNAPSKNEVHKLEYKSLNSIPSNLSNSQDYLGFYNGQNNLHLISPGSSKFLRNYLKNFSGNNDLITHILNKAKMENILTSYANREPNFELATNGILTKMTYPTKGYTKFEYEPVDKKFLYKTKTMHIYSNMGNTPLIWQPNSKYTDTNGISSTFIDENGITEPNVFTSQVVDINVLIRVDDSVTDLDLNYHDFIYIEAKNVQTGQIEEKRFNFPTEVMTSGYNNKEFNTTFSFTLSGGGGYVFKIGFGNFQGGTLTRIESPSQANNFTHTPLYVDASFTYISGIDETDGLGIRIKRVKDYKENNVQPTSIKRVYYKSLKDLFYNNNIDTQIYYPLFYGASLVEYDPAPDDPQSVVYSIGMLHLNSSFSTLYTPSSFGGSIYKNIVISEGGDNFEKGGIEKKFHIINSRNAEKFLATQFPYYENSYTIDASLSSFLTNYSDDVKTNENLNNGLLLEENFWKKQNNQFYKILKTKNEYSFNVTGRFHNTGGILLSETSPCPLDGNFWDIQFSLYDHIQEKANLSSSTKTDFIEPIPLTRYIPQTLYHGWANDDHDGDNVPNDIDDDYITPGEMLTMSDDDIEAPFKKIETKNEYQYESDLVGLPHKITTTNSKGETIVTKNFYPITSLLNQLDLSALTQNQIGYYNILKNSNRIDKPIQIEVYNGSSLLSKERIIYELWDEQTNLVMPGIIQNSKGANPLENRIIFHSYKNASPEIFSYVGGPKTKYFYNSSNQVVAKVENYQAGQPGELNDSNIQNTSPCTNASDVNLTTWYYYDPITELLIQTRTPNCKNTFYEYDELHRLKRIKDNENNVIKEFDYNYRPN